MALGDESAAAGEHEDAAEWLLTIEAADACLTDADQLTRVDWTSALLPAAVLPGCCPADGPQRSSDGLAHEGCASASDILWEARAPGWSVVERMPEIRCYPRWLRTPSVLHRDPERADTDDSDRVAAQLSRSQWRRSARRAHPSRCGRRHRAPSALSELCAGDRVASAAGPVEGGRGEVLTDIAGQATQGDGRSGQDRASPGRCRECRRKQVLPPKLPPTDFRRLKHASKTQKRPFHGRF
jgi:hypothetical protein